MSYHDEEYLTALDYIRTFGYAKSDRTGTGTISSFAQQMRFDLSDGTIPLLTTKKMFVKGILHEIFWYLRGDTNIKYLNDHGVHIWDEWADENGDLGPVYGAQWRSWPQYVEVSKELGMLPDNFSVYTDGKPIDQIAEAVHKLRNNPDDRRIIVSAWNVGHLDDMRLPPCHCMFQFWHDGNGGVSLHLLQRSCDMFLGVPFNIVQYSILLRMVAQVTGLKAREFVWTGIDCHIYSNHFNQVEEQTERDPFPSPYLVLNPERKELEEFVYEDFQIEGYEHHALIKAPVAV